MFKLKALFKAFLSFALLLAAAPAKAPLAQTSRRGDDSRQEQPSLLRGYVLLQYPDGQRVPVVNAQIDIYCVDTAIDKVAAVMFGGLAVKRKSVCDKLSVKTDDKGRFSVVRGISDESRNKVRMIAVSARDATPFVLTNVMVESKVDYGVILKPGNGKGLSEGDARKIAIGEKPQPGGADRAGEADKRRPETAGMAPSAVSRARGSRVARSRRQQRTPRRPR